MRGLGYSIKYTIASFISASATTVLNVIALVFLRMGLQRYLHWQEQKNHGKVVKVDFRNKKDFGWHAHIETLWFNNEKSVSSSVFKTLFYGHMILRPSCYECPFKSVMHG